MSLLKLAEYFRKELTESSNSEVSRFIKKTIIFMKEELRDVELEISDFTYHCREGCCEYSGKKVFLEGRELDIEDETIEEIIMALLSNMGYSTRVELTEDMPYKLN